MILSCHFHPPQLWSIDYSSSSFKTKALLEKVLIVASSNLTAWVSSLGPYLDDFASNILPSRVHSLIHTHVTPLLKLPAAQPQPALTERTALLLADYYTTLSYTTVAATLLGLIFFLYSMSSYGRSALDTWGGRRSPYTSSAGDRSITEYDFEYLGPEHLERSRSHPYDHRPSVARSHGYDDGEGPDIILLRHMNTQYELNFKPFAISDGILRISDIRRFAAETLRAPDPSRLRLLYKGKLLKDDKRPAKEYGLKQQSEIMAVVSETPPSRPNSDSETEESGSAVSYSSKKGRTRRRKPTTKRSQDNLAPSTRDGSPPSRKESKRSSRVPSPHPHPHIRAPPTQPSPPLSPPLQSPKSDVARAKVDQLASTFHTQWVPKCVQFLINPPSDAKMRDQEHKKLTESILAQVLLKADDIDTEGDVQARTDRKKLVGEINDLFKKLDATAKSHE
jgi:BAG domain/Ubiquitin family